MPYNLVTSPLVYLYTNHNAYTQAQKMCTRKLPGELSENSLKLKTTQMLTKNKMDKLLGTVVHAYNPSTLGGQRKQIT